MSGVSLTSLIFALLKTHVVLAMCSSSANFSDSTDDICNYNNNSNCNNEPSKDSSNAEFIDSNDNKNDSPLNLHPWAKGLRCNLLKHAQRLIHFL